MYELINKKYIKVKEYKGQRVVTFKDIDTVHERPDGTARKRFNDNKKRFIENVDFYKITPSEFRTAFSEEMDIRQQNDMTESGYLMIVKSFTDDLAWRVQRMLVNSYFRLQQKQKEKSLEKYHYMTKDSIVEAIIFLFEEKLYNESEI